MRILVVDDELITREWLCLTIPTLGREDEVCGQAKDGREALALVEALRPDVIFTDIKMPVMDGMGFVRALRQGGDATPVVMLSAYSEFEYVREALRQDAFEYLLKPEITPESLGEVLDRVRAALPAGQQPAKAPTGHSASTGEEELARAEAVLSAAGDLDAILSCCSPPVRECCEYVIAHYGERITLGDMAGRAYLNKNYFSELFKRETGMTFVRFLNLVRIAKAVELLTGKHATVTQAAVKTGFANTSYFDKVFKRMTGLSPAAYRKLKKVQLSENNTIL